MRNADTERARRIRQERSSTLGGLRNREDLATLLRMPPDSLWACPVWHALLSVPGIGTTKARELCEVTGIWPLARIDELDEHTRHALCRRLENP